MTVKKTSLFPASREVVFRKLQKLETLQTIAKPFATFEPVGETGSTWEVGSTSAYRFRLFGVIPFGKHTIHILRFEPDGISSHEGNEHVPVWNHDIQLIEKDETHTLYTDRVEIHAGWKTPFIWLLAKSFYQISDNLRNTSSLVEFWRGSREVYPEKSVALLKKQLLAMTERVFPQMGHCQFLHEHPEEYAALMDQMMRK